MPPVKFTFDVNKIAEASHDANIIITPEGPAENNNASPAGVDCELRSASERSWNLALAGDHVMAANNIGPVAVAHKYRACRRSPHRGQTHGINWRNESTGMAPFG
jgi:hypothetical protein